MRIICSVKTYEQFIRVSAGVSNPNQTEKSLQQLFLFALTEAGRKGSVRLRSLEGARKKKRGQNIEDVFIFSNSLHKSTQVILSVYFS